MKRLLLILIGFVVITADGFGQISYNASTIPENLKQGANVIKRSEEISFEVTDVDRAVYRIHRVVTVLNKEGNRSLLFYVLTNKYMSLEDFDLQVFDQSGSSIVKYKKKDLNKQAPGGGLISEGMFNYISATAPSYPVTIDMRYEVRYTGTLFYPEYDVQEDNEAVESSAFTLRVPKELGARFKEQKIKLQPQITDSNNILTYKWAVKDLPSFKNETGSASDQWSDPSILMAPNKFRIYNSSGDMSTWKNFGMWEKELTKGIDVLPEERKLFFQDLVKNAVTDKEKIAIVYKYLQENFRYVSIQLGIGGYQPFPAKFTDEKKYGDCKALSFYMYSVLKTIGIRSHIALINADYNQEPVDPLFPCSAFNHMILCVPQKSDSIWLECTSKTIDFNYLGSFTENRYALLITENGGALVSTPISKPSNNRFSVLTKINLNEDGSGQTSSMLYLNGDIRETVEDYFPTKSDEQKALIVNTLGFKQPDNFKLKRIDNDNTQIDLDIEKIPQFTAGSKMFLDPRIYRFWPIILPASKEERKQDYFFHFAQDRTDTTIYQLPENFTVDVLPKPVDKKCAYATYVTGYSYNKESNQLTSTARLVLYKNRIPADKYAEVKSFFDGVAGDESQKMVIKKN